VKVDQGEIQFDSVWTFNGFPSHDFSSSTAELHSKCWRNSWKEASTINGDRDWSSTGVSTFWKLSTADMTLLTIVLQFGPDSRKFKLGIGQDFLANYRESQKTLEIFKSHDETTAWSILFDRSRHIDPYFWLFLYSQYLTSEKSKSRSWLKSTVETSTWNVTLKSNETWNEKNEMLFFISRPATDRSSKNWKISKLKRQVSLGFHKTTIITGEQFNFNFSQLTHLIIFLAYFSSYYNFKVNSIQQF
jgi:hypothetical protein